MDPLTLMLITTLVTFAGGLITNAVNQHNVQQTNQSNQQSVTETNEANRLLAQQQHDWNVQDWQMQANYNAPAAQMQRFRDAGLNPNLIYGQMADGPTINSTSPNPMQANKAMPFLASNPVESLDPLAKARLDNIEANTELTSEQAETERSMRQARVDNLVAATENLGKQNEEIVARIQRMAKENDLTSAQINDISFNQMLKHGEYLLDVQRVQNETNLSEAEVKKLNADTKKALAEAKVTNREYQEMIWTYAIRKAGLNQQVHLTQMQAQQAAATAKKLGVEKDIEEWTAEGKREFTSWIKGEKGIAAQFMGCTFWLLEDAINSFGKVIH